MLIIIDKIVSINSQNVIFLIIFLIDYFIKIDSIAEKPHLVYVLKVWHDVCITLYVRHEKNCSLKNVFKKII